MAKTQHFTSVQNWVDTDYSVTTGDAGGLNETTLSKVGQVLRKVHPRSPAGLLGLQAGDILHAINGGIFNAEDLKKTLQPRMFGRFYTCLLYTSPSPRDQRGSRMPSSA